MCVPLRESPQSNLKIITSVNLRDVNIVTLSIQTDAFSIQVANSIASILKPSASLDQSSGKLDLVSR